MQVAVFQYTPVACDLPANLAQLDAGLRDVGADLVVLPELCTTGYQLTVAELAELAEPFPGGPTADALQAIARREGCHLVAGVAERGAGGKRYNSAVLVGPEGHRATYRKTHLFADEKAIFAPGDSGFFVTDVEGAKVGMMVCFDWIFPESARSLALAGADIIAHPANLVLPWCQRSMPLRCLENGVFAATANRCGSEDRIAERPGLTFTGQSVIVDPRGELLQSAPTEGDALLRVEIDPTQARNKQLNPANDLLGDRRPEHYGLLDSSRT